VKTATQSRRRLRDLADQAEVLHVVDVRHEQGQVPAR
jgi:hypothetical protein